jgi:hypothetical protein
MTIDEIYRLVLYSTAKNLQQGYVSPDDFNLTINQAQKSYVSYLLGSFQQYMPGRAVARVEFGQNTIVRTRLAPIIHWDNLTVDPTGFCPYPSDYLQSDAMFTDTGYDRIRCVQQDSLYSFYNSKIDPIATNPIYILEDVGFRFFPINIGFARLSYVANPPDMVWAYADNANGIPVFTTGIQGVNVITGGSGYSSATVTFSAPSIGGVQATGTVTLSGGVVTGIVMTNNGSGYTGLTPTITFTGVGGAGATFSAPIISVNPVWDDASILEIIVRALALIGVNLQLNTVEQYSMAIKNQGQ